LEIQLQMKIYKYSCAKLHPSSGQRNYYQYEKVTGIYGVFTTGKMLLNSNPQFFQIRQNKHGMLKRPEMGDQVAPVVKKNFNVKAINVV
jgi:hypothetical protein